MDTSTERPTRKFRGRIYTEAPVKEVQPGDIISYIDNGRYTAVVSSVAPSTVLVNNPRGYKTKTKRVSRKNIVEVWKWHKNAL